MRTRNVQPTVDRRILFASLRFARTQERKTEIEAVRHGLEQGQMQSEPRTAVILGTNTATELCGTSEELPQWRFVQAPTIEAAEAVLNEDKSIRVGLWAHSAGLEEHLTRFPLLRAKHKLVQWLAVIGATDLHDERIASHIAQHFLDFLTTPTGENRLCASLGHAHGMACLLERIDGQTDVTSDEEQMVGTSESMRQLFRDIRKVASSDAPVFISGESGTGKELTARAIHERSTRAGGPFVAVDCAAIAPTLIHSELFGYEKGAFTGAGQRKIGRIEVAQGGTLFLDEIGDLSLELQGNLLRFIQDSTIQRVGSTRPIEVNVRVIAATHIDLERAVKQGTFREDLYYRLNVLRLELPPLRERGSDVEVLARYFLAQFAKDSSKSIRGYTKQAIDAIRRHTWPGNVRELINRVRRAVVMCDGAWITPRDLDLERGIIQGIQIMPLDAARDSAERKALDQAMKLCNNNYSAVARMLGVSRVTLYRLLEKHRALEQGMRLS
jgi:DNA-binding NtrC family response regulator